MYKCTKKRQNFIVFVHFLLFAVGIRFKIAPMSFLKLSLFFSLYFPLGVIVEISILDLPTELALTLRSCCFFPYALRILISLHEFAPLFCGFSCKYTSKYPLGVYAFKSNTTFFRRLADFHSDDWRIFIPTIDETSSFLPHRVFQISSSHIELTCESIAGIPQELPWVACIFFSFHRCAVKSMAHRCLRLFAKLVIGCF